MPIIKQRLLSAIVVTLALLPASAKAGSYGMRLADGRTVSLTVPDACKMTGDGRGSRMSCDYKTADGDFRNIVLSANTMSLPRFLDAFSTDPAEFRSAPEPYMRAILRTMEQAATGSPPGPGQRLMQAESEIVQPAPGTDTCLRFDFDYTGPLGPLGDVRSDNGGLRCLSFDAGKDEVTYIFLECMNLHGDLRRRDAAHDRETRAVAASLRVRE
jgi:hypothetical protein